MDQKSIDSVIAKALAQHDQYKEHMYETLKIVFDNNRQRKDTVVYELITSIIKILDDKDENTSLIAKLSLVAFVDYMERYFAEIR